MGEGIVGKGEQVSQAGITKPTETQLVRIADKVARVGGYAPEGPGEEVEVVEVEAPRPQVLDLPRPGLYGPYGPRPQQGPYGPYLPYGPYGYNQGGWSKGHGWGR